MGDVLQHVNEDKRKSDSKIEIFNIVYSVQYCPIELVSANRSFYCRIDAVCKHEGIFHNRKDDRFAMFRFNDCIEVARWKREFYDTSKNRSKNSKPDDKKKNTSRQVLKHFCVIKNDDIRRVMDITETDDTSHHGIGLELDYDY